MKKLIITAIMLISALTFAQEKPKTETIYVYNYTNGVREISPTKIIEKTNTDIKVFEVKDGIKQIQPQFIVKENKVYEIKNGVQQLLPQLEVRINSPSVFFIDNSRNIFNPFIN